MSTPTPIHTFEDILAAMENDPSLRAAMRQHILGEEFLQLPAIVRELQQTVAQLAQTLNDFMAATNLRLERLEAGQARLEQDVTELKGGQARLEGSVNRLEGNVNRLEGNVNRLEGNVNRLEGNVSRLEGSVSRLEGSVSRLEGNVNRLIGSDYERKAARRASRLAQRYLGMNAMTVIYAITRPDDNRLSELLDRAVNDNLISADDADEIENADIVMSGPSGYAVAEVSVTLDAEDIQRARERADLLAKATGTTVPAAAIGTRALDEAVNAARQQRVTIMTLAE